MRTDHVGDVDVDTDFEPLELNTLSKDGDTLEPIPLVFIEGWAAGTSAKIFSGLDGLLNEQKAPDDQPRRMLVIKCGAYSSLWDRAHEIYAALKGGTCDYGEEHSITHAHARYGRTHENGLYENWSEDYPLHFVGHSFGGATIYFLQHLLTSGQLLGSPAMMRSIITISSPLRGTPLATSIGQLDGPTAGQKRFSIGWMMAVGVHLARTANVIAQDVYDFGADQWSNTDTETDTSSRGVTNFLQSFFPSKGQAFSADCAGYDLLVDSMERYNQKTSLCDRTFYRSYTATTCLHIPNGIDVDTEPPPLPGVWHVRTFDNTTHFELVDYLWKVRTLSKTRQFWNELGIWLRRVDQEATSIRQETVKGNTIAVAEA
ncbi:protein of unknown function [Taphrina deformans PYCC 5710]|uniref:Lipase-like C-terminal domain-containing protein n=1 Tax=Taphrina deformans (strain PYCC 5710 / ATCC 11124 / CBS 356.35 / IMI 108563 / JCM 9778 / NBRC 8474) TaxID=1097556 RepID=R4X6W6_TAPDE|nr:protein of unknown function [Taphrina deformans PYCC 5710]|eukprot:CCG80967.1 protein of unknown function [Taphrina deformans PYCC 5710]